MGAGALTLNVVVVVYSSFEQQVLFHVCERARAKEKERGERNVVERIN